jgi:hypothetical protein
LQPPGHRYHIKQGEFPLPATVDTGIGHAVLFEEQ